MLLLADSIERPMISDIPKFQLDGRVEQQVHSAFPPFVNTVHMLER